MKHLYTRKINRLIAKKRYMRRAKPSATTLQNVNQIKEGIGWAGNQIMAFKNPINSVRELLFEIV